jgi:uncharacterized membrane protein YkvA (DUF1232 family)
VDVKKSSVLQVLRHPSAFVRFLRDREAPLLPRLLALFAVLYVILPFDAIPDVIPIVGWLDDVGVIALVVAWTAKRVTQYVPQADDGVVVKQA